MKKDSKFSRQYLRAPFFSDVLYIDGEYVLRCRSLNLSEGGMLLTELPRIPERDAFPLMVSLTKYPKFSLLSADKILKMSFHDLDHQVMKLKSRIVRNFKNPLNSILNENVGIQFYPLASGDNELIIDYVGTYLKNIIFLLNMFEGKQFNHNKNQDQLILKKAADILGYDISLPIPLLRQKILHDYQSLESL